MENVPNKSKTNLDLSKIKINWKYHSQQYGAALAVTIFLFIILSIYLFYRHGYYDLYVANKVFANVAAVLLGIVLLIGPGSRLFSIFDRYLQYRKELGITAFFLVLIHGVVSFFFLPSKFPRQQFFETGFFPFIFGLAATIILIAIFFISNEWAINTIGRAKWWRWQYQGVRLVFALILFHVFLKKGNDWIRWYQVGGGKNLAHPEWPGAGLLVGLFLIFVVLIRIAEFINPKFGRVVWYVSFVALPVIYIITFWWGRQFIR